MAEQGTLALGPAPGLLCSMLAAGTHLLPRPRQPQELGMVNTVLTDKTGTLTCNVMEFFKASIGGVSYGAGVTEIERANAARRGVPLSAEADAASPVREQYFNFYDERIMGGEWAQQPNPQLAREFFRMLALCHTVIPDGMCAGQGPGWCMQPRHCHCRAAASATMRGCMYSCQRSNPLPTHSPRSRRHQARPTPARYATRQSRRTRRRWWLRPRCLASSSSSAPTPRW